MKLVLGIIFALIGGFLGAAPAGQIASALVDTQKFASPDEHALFLTVAEIGLTVVAMLAGAIVGVLLARPLKRHFIRTDIT